MVKMQLTDTQTSFAYAIYVMAGSYFRKTECAHPMQEKKMRFQYFQQKEDKQYKMEDICLKHIENEMVSKFPEKVWQQEMKAHFVVGSDGAVQGVRFTSDEYIVTIGGKFKGPKTQLESELWVKEQPKAEKPKAKKAKTEKSEAKEAKAGKTGAEPAKDEMPGEEQAKAGKSGAKEAKAEKTGAKKRQKKVA